jgi:hypothetical protein
MVTSLKLDVMRRNQVIRFLGLDGAKSRFEILGVCNNSKCRMSIVVCQHCVKFAWQMGHYTWNGAMIIAKTMIVS